MHPTLETIVRSAPQHTGTLQMLEEPEPIPKRRAARSMKEIKAILSAGSSSSLRKAQANAMRLIGRPQI